MAYPTPTPRTSAAQAAAPRPDPSSLTPGYRSILTVKLDLPLELTQALVTAALRFRAAEPWPELANTDYLLVDESPHGLRAPTRASEEFWCLLELFHGA
jgi:hypothetical protein